MHRHMRRTPCAPWVCSMERSLSPLKPGRSFDKGLAVKLQDFRIGLRVLAKDPVYSLVSILGLGVGLAVCLLLLGYARYCWEYNAYIPDADNVYIVKQRNNLELGAPWYDQAPLLLLAAARTTPGVTNASGYVGWFPLTIELNGQLRKLRSLTVLPGFAEIMGLRLTKSHFNKPFSP